MKTPLKSVLATLVALFLSISLSGCFEEDTKTVSQGGDVSSSMFHSGDVKLILKPGVKEIFFYFSDGEVRRQQSEKIKAALESRGIVISEALAAPDNGFYFGFTKSVTQRLIVDIDKTGLVGINILSSFGSVAKWDPAIGDEVRYAG